MKPQDRYSYFGKVISIKKANEIGDFQKILIQEELTGKINSYKAHDVLFLTTHDKIAERYCKVIVNAKNELVTIMLDETKEIINHESLHVYQYDQDVLQTFLSVSLHPIYSTLRQNQLDVLNNAENKDYFLQTLRTLPEFVLDQGHFHEYKKQLTENKHFIIKPDDSEIIHFYCYAYEAAKQSTQLEDQKQKALDSANQIINDVQNYGDPHKIYIKKTQIKDLLLFFDSQIQGIHNLFYEEYIHKAVDQKNLIPFHVFQQHILVFIEDIVNAKNGNSISIKQQRAAYMFDNIEPLLKYYMFENHTGRPLTESEYSYLYTVYVAQNIYNTFSGNEYFDDQLSILIKVYKQLYPHGIKNIIIDKYDIAYCNEHLFEYEVFGPEGEVEMLLYEAFDGLIAETITKFDNNENNTLLGKIHEMILGKMNGGTYLESWLYYTICTIERIHQLKLDNKNQNTIQKT